MNNSIMTEQPKNIKAGRLSMAGLSQDNGMEDMTTFHTTTVFARGTSVPARFKQPMGTKATADFDPDIGKPMVWKRKRG
jgi:hypothetical protein